MPEKKNQHFIPRFYLKKFSLESQGTRIGMFNISSKKFIESAKLYDQASRNYFYGRDLKIENDLQNLETESAKIINYVIEKQDLPQANSTESQMLLMFVITLFGRTMYSAEMIDELRVKHNELVSSIDENFLPESEQNINLTDMVQQSLGRAASFFPLLRDLHYKLIINETEQPFITSDHPVVLYNQFLEPRKKHGSNIGFASKGLEIFLPLSPKLTLIYFDKDVYRVGTRDKTVVKVNLTSDIKALNLLQCINANKNIYFNKNFSEIQTRECLVTANHYSRNTKANLDQYPNDENHEILLHSYFSNVKCDLKLSFITIVKKARAYKLDQKVVHVRNEKLCRLFKKFLELVNRGFYKRSEFDRFMNDYDNRQPIQ